AGMKKLQGLRSLRRLDLSTTAITDAGLQHLKTLTNLQELDLESSQITVAGVARFRQSLPNCEIKSYAMLVLEPDPKVLNLAKVIDLTDVDLEFIRGLTGLEELNLEGTPVTDAGLEHLKGMATLQKLHLYNTQVSDSGVARLKQTLPRCSIDH
ncbi:MAG: hypothetical protein K8T91_22190, partial [Planctomycetes bacterium]|nr:hypothetical protein [Planctomycetota bacterium]